MEKMIIKQKQGMRWWMKTGLVLLLTLASSAFMEGGLRTPKPAEAAISTLQPWSNIYNSAAYPTTMAVTKPVGTRRMMVVAVTSNRTVAGAMTCTVSLGGQTFVKAVQDEAATSLGHTWLFYLNEAGITASTNTTLTLTVGGGGTAEFNRVYYAVYDGVDQSLSPLTDFENFNSGTTTNAAVGPFAVALNIASGDQAVEIVDVTRVGSTTAYTISSFAAGWTSAVGPNSSTTTNAQSSYVVLSTTAGSSTSQHTASGIAVRSMSAMSIKAFVPLPSTITTCNGCHGNPPVDGTRAGATGQFAGDHTKHAATYAYACTECHYNHGSNTAHSSGFKNVSGARLSGTAYSQGKKIAISNAPVFGSCGTTAGATAYCHSAGTGGTGQVGDVRPLGAPAVTMTWATTAGTCSSCHTGGTASGPTYTSGSPKANSHAAHRVTNGYTCEICHYGTTTNGTTVTTIANHVDKQYDLTPAPTANFTYTYASTGGKCTSSKCHGGAGINLPWGANLGTAQCTKCHGDGSTAYANFSSAQIAPGFGATGNDLANGTGVTVRGGTHQGHLTAATGISDKIHCGECHKVVTTVNAATHMLYTTSRPLFTGNLATAQSHVPSVTRTSGIINCNNTYCHTGKLNTGAAMTPAWNNSTYISASMTMADCKKCHNMPPNPGVAGIHSGIPAALTAFPVGTTCNCHSNLAPAGNTYATIFTDKLKHINGIIEGGHAFPYSGLTHMTAAGTTPWSSCSGTGCHSTSATGVTYASWASTGRGTAPNCTTCHISGLGIPSGTSSCWDCHGVSATNGWPNGAAFPNNNRSHTAHTAIAGITCAYCHTGGGTGTATHGDSNAIAKTQANVVVVLGAQAGTAATWTLAGETCGTSICHGQKSPGWGITASSNQCTKCHGQANTAYANTSSSIIAPGGAGRDTGGKTLATDARVGAHQGHLLGSSNVADKVHCGECHVKVATVSDATHLNMTTATITFPAGGLARANTHSPTVTRVNGLINCSTTYCHSGGVRAEGTAAGQSGFATRAALTWNNSTLINGTTVAGTCAAKCHMLPPGAGLATDNHVGLTAVTTFAGLATCSSNAPATGCHPTIQGTAASITSIATIWKDAAAKLLHLDGKIDGGTCVGCHSKVQTGTHGTPRDAVKNEFGLAWGHKKSTRTAVTDADCIVCHLEGNWTTQKTSAKHADGNIDLRDPTVNGEVAITNMSNAVFTFTKFATSYAAGSRTTTGNTANTIDNVITQKFCLGCHRAGGAVNTTARTPGGSATMPFGGINTTYTVVNGAAAAGGLVDVKTQFATTNSSRHPVLGPNTKDYPWSTRLAIPYNGIGTARNSNSGGTHTTALSVVMNCFDCHNVVGAPLTTRTVTAHGNNVTLRGNAYSFGSAASLCTICHTGYTASSNTHGSGSAGQWNGDSGEGVNTNCNSCHGSNTGASKPLRPLGAQDFHGNNALVGGGLWPTINARPVAFIRGWSGGAYHRGYRLAGTNGYTTGSATCGNGTCPGGGAVGDGNTRSYSPGGTY